MLALDGKPFTVQLGGWNTQSSKVNVYPDSPDLNNVYFGRFGEVIKTAGYTTYSDTAMTDVSAAKEVVTGVFEYTNRSGTKYTIICTPTRIMACPAGTGAWTVLVSGLTTITTTDYWDACVFNNKLVLTNGKTSAYVTLGTAATTTTLASNAVWKTLTVRTVESKVAGHATTVSEDEVLSLGGWNGTNYRNSYLYSIIGDAWRVTTPESFRYGHYNGHLYGISFVVGGVDGAYLTKTEGRLDGEETWRYYTSCITARDEGASFVANNRLFVVSGETTGAALTATAESYDPATDGWTAVTAFGTATKSPGSFSINNLGYVFGGATAGPIYVNDAFEYNPFTDAWTAKTDYPQTFAGMHSWGDAYSGEGWGLCGDDGGVMDNTMAYSYSPISNAWTAETAYPIATYVASGGSVDLTGIGIGGEKTGSTAQTAAYSISLSLSAPSAQLCEAFGGYVFLARTTSFPSRVFYSAPGNETAWLDGQFFDVQADDGYPITGIFKFDNRLYVSKANNLYRITGDVFDPEEGNQSIPPTPIAGCVGTIAPRSIVVTELGVFYLAQDGFRVFDGSTSRMISDKIQNTIDGYVASRLKYTAGVLNRARDEIWWSMTSTGSTHDVILRYNFKQQKWSRISGTNAPAAESIGIVRDSNDVDQILYGTASTTDGKIYKADTGTTFNGNAISGYYRTGWYAPMGPYRIYNPAQAYLFVERTGNHNLSVDWYVNFDTATKKTDAVALLSGTYPDTYFQDANDLRAKVSLPSMAGYSFQTRFSNASASQSFAVYALGVEGTQAPGVNAPVGR